MNEKEYIWLNVAALEAFVILYTSLELGILPYWIYTVVVIAVSIYVAYEMVFGYLKLNHKEATTQP